MYPFKIKEIFGPKMEESTISWGVMIDSVAYDVTFTNNILMKCRRMR